MKRLTYILLTICISSCYNKKPELTGKEGKPLPSFSILLHDSTTNFDTKNISTGELSVLIYFSPHCSFSRAQIEEIIKDIADLKDLKFYFFTSSSFSSMRALYNHYQLSKYPNIFCGIDYSNYFKDYFQPPGFPYIAIYGKDKKLKQAFLGQTSIKVIKDVMKE